MPAAISASGPKLTLARELIRLIAESYAASLAGSRDSVQAQA